jgi:hypothetical protein
MARTVISKTALPGPFAQAGVVMAFTAADVANLNDCTLTGNEVLIAWNSDASGHNVTVTSVGDSEGRTGNVTDPIAAGAYHVYQRFPLNGWLETDGNLYFQADNALVKFAILQLQ